MGGCTAIQIGQGGGGIYGGHSPQALLGFFPAAETFLGMECLGPAVGGVGQGVRGRVVR